MKGIYRVIRYFRSEVDPQTEAGLSILGRPLQTREEAERDCGHKHRSLKAAVKCARSLAQGYRAGVGDCCARVEDAEGTVLHDFHGSIKIS